MGQACCHLQNLRMFTPAPSYSGSPPRTSEITAWRLHSLRPELRTVCQPAIIFRIGSLPSLPSCLLIVMRAWQTVNVAPGPWVSHLALDHCLDDRYLNFHTFLGWMVTAANVANALVAAVCLVFVVCLRLCGLSHCGFACGQGYARWRPDLAMCCAWTCESPQHPLTQRRRAVCNLTTLSSWQVTEPRLPVEGGCVVQLRCAWYVACSAALVRRWAARKSAWTLRRRCICCTWPRCRRCRRSRAPSHGGLADQTHALLLDFAGRLCASAA